MKFKFLTGDCNWLDYGAKWTSPKFNNGEFDYWLVLELINMDDACGRDNEGQSKYNVSVSAVSPSQVSEKEMRRAIDSCSAFDGVISEVDEVECLHSYGVSAPLWQSDGNNANKLLQEARKQAQIITSFTFGFAMDRAVNRIGTTGWEAIKGDLDSAMSRTIASGTTEGNILAKMHGLPLTTL